MSKLIFSLAGTWKAYNKANTWSFIFSRYVHIFGRPFVKRFALCYQTVVYLSVCLSCLSVTVVHCGQTVVGRLKMKLGVHVGLGPGHIVFDVDPATPEKGHTHSHPIFVPCPLWPNGWMDEDAAWYGSRPRLRPHCTRRGPSSRERGQHLPPLFGPSLLWPRSPISATTELLLLNS